MSENSIVSIEIRRVEIEARIRHCRNAAFLNLVEIGRWLNIAKAEGVVPHGKWMSWAQENSGLSERDMQRAMQIARELPEGSPLERLGKTKISALLTLPAGEREEVAARIDAEHATSREVAAQVKAIREERDEALRLVGVQKRQLKEAREKAEREVDAAVKDAIAAEREDAERKVREMEDKLRQQDSLIRSGEKGRRQTSKLLGEAQERAETLRGDLLKSEAERARLEEELAQTRKGGGISLAAQEEIDGLKKQLAAREREIDQLTEQLDETQMDLARAGLSGGGMRVDPTTVILSAIGALMAEAGSAPGELDRVVSPIDEETRRLVLTQAYQVKQWAGAIIVKLGGEMRG